MLRWLLALPEFYLVLMVLGMPSLHGLAWTPMLLVALPLVALSFLSVLTTVIAAGTRADDSCEARR